MELILFTLVAAALYLVSDWLLKAIEQRLGRRLEHRSLVFLAILMPLALLSFSLIRHLAGT